MDYPKQCSVIFWLSLYRNGFLLLSIKMASKLKQIYNKYRENRTGESNTSTFGNVSKEDVTEPINNTFVHINGTMSNITDRSHTLSKNKNSSSVASLTGQDDEADCIVVDNSKFYDFSKMRDAVSVTGSGETDDFDGAQLRTSSIGEAKTKPTFDFRNISFIEPVKDYCCDTKMSSDSTGSDYEFDQCSRRPTIEQTVAEKYKLGELTMEMDESFFDMTEDERIYHEMRRKQCTDADLESVPISTTTNSSVQDKPVYAEMGGHRTLRTPPPPPKPIRKNSKKVHPKY